MILRRLNQHARDQNWIAVGLDFLIVILGVFIGIQLGNWNGDLSDRAAYRDALERYRAEIADNIDTLAISDADTLVRVELIGQALDTLSACDESPEGLDLVNDALNKAMGTSGLSIRSRTLEELSSSPRLLDQQTEEDRRRFSETAHLVKVFEREAQFAEVLPLEKRLQDNPIIEVGPADIRDVSYYGQDYSRRDRRLRLAVPLAAACQNDQLIKDLYTWERWQAAVPAVSRIFRTRLEEDLAWLEQRG